MDKKRLIPSVFTFKKGNLRTIFLPFLSILFIAAASINLANAQLLPDVSFNKTAFWMGKISNQTGPQNAIQAASQPDGRVVVIGTCFGHTGWGMRRFNIDGTPDLSFGINGISYGDESRKTFLPKGVFVLPNGNIMVFGIDNYNINAFGSLFAFYSNGAVDTTFADKGHLDLNGIVVARFTCAAVLEDGSFMMGGQKDDVIPINFLMKFTAKAIPDSSFGNNAQLNFKVGIVRNSMASLHIDSAGNYILNYQYDYTTNRYYAISRLSSKGQTDFTFGKSGIATALVSNQIDYQQAGSLAKAGGFVQASYAKGVFQLAKFTKTGFLDSAWGKNGIVRLNRDSTVVKNLLGVYVRKDDKTLLVFNKLNKQIVFVLLKSNGKLDSIYGTNGYLNFEYYFNHNVNALGSSLSDDNKLYICGGFTTDTAVNWSLYRFADKQTIKIKLKSEFWLYPNPVQSTATLAYKLDEPTLVSISLLNLNGQKITDFYINYAEISGYHEKVINLPEWLKNGIYILKYEADKKVIYTKIMVN